MGRALSPNGDRSQHVQSRQRKACREHARNEVQALSKQAQPPPRPHILLSIPAQRRGVRGTHQTLPPSKKQSQDISYLHEQARLECTPTPRCKHCPRKPIRASTRHPLSLPARRTSPSLWPNPSAKHEAIAKTSTLGVHAHTEVQALSKHAHPALTPCPTVGCGTPAEPFVHQARSNRKLSRLLTNKPAWSARPHRGASIVRASPSEHQLDTHSHSPPAAGGGTPPAPTPQAYVPMMGAMCLKGRRRGIGVPPRPAHAGRSPPYIVHSGFFGSGRLAYEKAEMSHHAINFDCVIIMTGT